MSYPKISLPKGLYKRLKLESKKTGKEPAKIVAYVLSQYLEDIDDIEFCEREFVKLKSGKTKLIALEDLD